MFAPLSARGAETERARGCERMAQEHERRFGEFDARMRRLRGGTGADSSERPSHSPMAGSKGLHVGIELVAGLIGGSLIGYGLDVWLGTSPVLFIVFFFLGAAAGLLNAYRYIQRLSEVPDARSGRDRAGRTGGNEG